MPNLPISLEANKNPYKITKQNMNKCTESWSLCLSVLEFRWTPSDHSQSGSHPPTWQVFKVKRGGIGPFFRGKRKHLPNSKNKQIHGSPVSTARIGLQWGRWFGPYKIHQRWLLSLLSFLSSSPAIGVFFWGGRSFSNLRVCQKMNGPRLCHLYGRLCHLYLCHPWLCDTTMGRSLVSSDIWWWWLLIVICPSLSAVERNRCSWYSFWADRFFWRKQGWHSVRGALLTVFWNAYNK